MSNGNPSDPMEFLRNLWGGNGFSLPGMVTPTLDTDELEKQIRDLKTVEGWLRTNLSMLSMTIQNLEMQRTTLTAMKNMSQMYSEHAQGGGEAPAAGGDAFAQAAMWPWNMMQQMQATMQNAATEAGQAAAEAAKSTASSVKAAAEAASNEAKSAARRKKP